MAIGQLPEIDIWRKGKMNKQKMATIILIPAMALAVGLTLLFFQDWSISFISAAGDKEQSIEWPIGMIVSDGKGIYAVPFNSPEQPTVFESDQFYEKLLWFYPDTRGGLIYQHDVTPPPFPAGAVLWLRAGSVQPEVLIKPQGRWFSGTYPRAGILPGGIATSREGHALFVYIVDTGSAGGAPVLIMTADLDNNGESRQIGILDTKGYGGIWTWYISVITGGEIFGLVDYDYDAQIGERCVSVDLFWVDTGLPYPLPYDCLPGRGPVSMSHDGRTLGLVTTNESIAWKEEMLPIVVIDLATGQILEEGVIEVKGYQDFSFISGSEDWLLYVQTPDEIRLVDIHGNNRLRIPTELIPIEWSPGPFDAPRFFHQPFNIPPEASLGSGLE
jgi:hypothetical protein